MNTIKKVLHKIVQLKLTYIACSTKKTYQQWTNNSNSKTDDETLQSGLPAESTGIRYLESRNIIYYTSFINYPELNIKNYQHLNKHRTDQLPFTKT